MADVAYIALGSNLGRRSGFLASARAALSLLPGSQVLAASPVEETIPFGHGAQGPYLNQMVAVSTTLTPSAMLARLHGIERQLGRIRTARWAPRTIDLDIVRFGTMNMTLADLVVPHPGLATRDFWQREVLELDRLVEQATRRAPCSCPSGRS